MSLLFPVLLLVVVMVAVLIAVWDWEDQGIGLMFGLLLLAFGAGLVALGYGIYGWLRFEQWAAVSVVETLHWLDKLGIGTSLFLGRSDWTGVQRISDIYLGSNIGWTLCIVAFAGFHVGEKLQQYDDDKKRKRATKEATEVD